MEGSKNFLSLIAIISSTMLVISVKGQISSPCTTSMVSSFTPCLNFITGSSSSGVSPTAGCCDAVKSLMSGGMDCACLIVTGNVPLSLPINRTLAISLPRACKSSGGIPLQCKATGVPLPAPGPVLFGPTSSPLSPDASAPFSPTASKAAEMALPPVDDTTTPASPTVSSVVPTATPGIRPVVTPTSTSASNPSYIPSPFVLLAFIGIMVFKCC